MTCVKYSICLQNVAVEHKISEKVPQNYAWVNALSCIPTLQATNLNTGM